jgi:hypothetical protein
MIDIIANKINQKADDFEEVRKVALEIVSEINEKTKYQLELRISRPYLLIEIKDLDKIVKISPHDLKQYAMTSGRTIKDQILWDMNSAIG